MCIHMQKDMLLELKILWSMSELDGLWKYSTPSLHCRLSSAVIFPWGRWLKFPMGKMWMGQQLKKKQSYSERAVPMLPSALEVVMFLFQCVLHLLLSVKHNMTSQDVVLTVQLNWGTLTQQNCSPVCCCLTSSNFDRAVLSASCADYYFVKCNYLDPSFFRADVLLETLSLSKHLIDLQRL